MTEDEDTSTPDRPGKVMVVPTLDGSSVVRADRYIHVSLGSMIQLHAPGSTDIEFGTGGHGLGRVRYRKMRYQSDQVYLYERVNDASSES